MSQAPVTADGYGPRDWMLPTTEGAYMNRCWDCRELFVGYKRSMTCRACTPNPMPRVEERETAAGVQEVSTARDSYPEKGGGACTTPTPADGNAAGVAAGPKTVDGGM